jgi:hypothetical protein
MNWNQHLALCRWWKILTFGLSGTFTLCADDSAALFKNQVQPLLEQHCWSCHSHGADKLRAGLFLDSRSGFIIGGDSGPALVPGDPDSSLMIQAIRYGNLDLQMPPRTKLEPEAIQILESWVRSGAPWPTELSLDDGAKGASGFDLGNRRQSHWAWQPVVAPSVPVVQGNWVQQPIDAFILAAMEEKGVRPANSADRRTLIRRLSYVLTGLPPNPEAAKAFIEDPRTTQETVSAMVDDLLRKPEFGERWARHWLDVMRYSETLGHEFDYELANAWRYRDYVIRAFNQDVPYNQFVREHIAGDLLESPRLNLETGVNESLSATAFYWFSQQVHSPVDIKAQEVELIDNQIDTLTRGFQALTVSCARCHDHKFDAISTRDFYALYGVLKSSRYRQADLAAPEIQNERWTALAQLRTTLLHAVEQEESRLYGDTAGIKTSENLKDAPALTAKTSEDPENLDSLTSTEDLALNRWFREGLAMVDSQVDAGDILYLTSDKRLQRVLRPFSTSRKVSRHLEGTLHSPTFPISNRYLHLLVAGKDTRARVVMENFHVIRAPIYGEVQKGIGKETFHWLTFDLNMWLGRRAYIELVDRVPAGLGDTLAARFPAEGWFDLAAAIPSDNGQPPDIGKWVEELPELEGVKEHLSRLDQAGQDARVEAWIPAIMDGDGVDQPVLVRGGPNRPGEPVRRRYLEALGGLDHVPDAASGRREVAEIIASSDNPLTARVWVNRVWHHVFGRGIVATVDDFGVLGDRPSHPELLDWLAHWFVTEGEWSTHRLIRLLLTSATWGQSAVPADPEYEVLDPINQGFHKWTLRRLEGEIIRDTLLHLSGRLDRTRYGPSVPVHLTGFMTGRGRPSQSGPLDGDGRRSIYLEMRRNFMSPFLLTFDTPQVAQTFGRRTQSNVPAQALILMNDPFVQKQAEAWADRMLSESGKGDDERLNWLYQHAFQRKPTASEQSAMLGYLDNRRAELQSEKTSSTQISSEVQSTLATLGTAEECLPTSQADLVSSTDGGGAIASRTIREVWIDLCHVLLNTKELIFLN